MDYASLQVTVTNLLRDFGTSVSVVRDGANVFRGGGVFTDTEKVPLAGSAILGLSTTPALATWVLLPVTRTPVLVGDTVVLRDVRDWLVQEVQVVAPGNITCLQKVRLA